MIVEIQATIRASRPAVWAAITDIERAAEFVGGIEKIEILERPATGLIGLKWRETRILFGKPASAEKRIIEAVENEFYRTEAESDGFLFLTTKRISDGAGGTALTEIHETIPRTFSAKLMSIPMGLLFKGVAKKAVLRDLRDIQAAAEKQ